MRAEPFRFTAEQRARLDAMTDEEVERAAASDPDAPGWTDEELARSLRGRDLRLAREARGMELPAFAARYRLPLDALQAVERGAAGVDPALLAYLEVILREPEAVERALAAARAGPGALAAE